MSEPIHQSAGIHRRSGEEAGQRTTAVGRRSVRRTTQPHREGARSSIAALASDVRHRSKTLAADLRAVIGQEETGPIRNLTALVERAGVCIIPIAGAWARRTVIVGQRNTCYRGGPFGAGDRLRFSLGHECGHLIFHERPHDSAESDANRFAGSLLFPKADFDAAMVDKPRLQHFIEMKSSWGISVAARSTVPMNSTTLTMPATGRCRSRWLNGGSANQASFSRSQGRYFGDWSK